MCTLREVCRLPIFLAESENREEEQAQARPSSPRPLLKPALKPSKAYSQDRLNADREPRQLESLKAMTATLLNLQPEMQ